MLGFYIRHVVINFPNMETPELNVQIWQLAGYTARLMVMDFNKFG